MHKKRRAYARLQSNLLTSIKLFQSKFDQDKSKNLPGLTNIKTQLFEPPTISLAPHTTPSTLLSHPNTVLDYRPSEFYFEAHEQAGAQSHLDQTDLIHLQRY